MKAMTKSALAKAARKENTVALAQPGDAENYRSVPANDREKQGGNSARSDRDVKSEIIVRTNVR